MAIRVDGMSYTLQLSALRCDESGQHRVLSLVEDLGRVKSLFLSHIPGATQWHFDSVYFALLLMRSILTNAQHDHDLRAMPNAWDTAGERVEDGYILHDTQLARKVLSLRESVGRVFDEVSGRMV